MGDEGVRIKEVSTLLVDPEAAPDPKQPSVPGGQAGQPGDQPASPPDGETAAPSPAGQTCASCDAPIQDGQQWCLQCGAAQPGSLGERPRWRSLAAVGVVSAALLAGAAVAAAAALNENSAPPRSLVIAQVPAPGATATTLPAATPPATTTPPSPGAKGSSPGGTTSTTPPAATANPLFPPASTKPPKIPAPTTTPKSSGSTGAESTGSTGGGSTTTPSTTGTSKTNTTTTESKSPGGSSGNTAEPPSPILLDTDAASTYNPYHYPEAGFGDPALAIDGETSTAWTAKANPSVAPRMAEGLLIDLKSPTKLGSLEVRTASPGMTVQVFGAGGAKAPAAITDPGWTQLHPSHVLKKDTHLALHTGGQALRFLVVWITRVPIASVGTPQAPGHVSLNEVVLFPPAA
jgi:hypothetical protein